MKELTKNELLDIEGGSVSLGVCLVIGAGIVFLLGVIDGLVRPLECRWIVKVLKDEELFNIVGGSISASMINYLVRGIEAIFELGQSFGTAIRRAKENKICPLE